MTWEVKEGPAGRTWHSGKYSIYPTRQGTPHNQRFGLWVGLEWLATTATPRLAKAVAEEHALAARRKAGKVRGKNKPRKEAQDDLL